MDATIFWNIIGEYNQQTIFFQIILLIFEVIALFLAYTGKNKWIAKFTLGVVNLYIGIVFFGLHGTEPIQKFFAFPLYIFVGVLFLYESYKNRSDKLAKPNALQVALLLLYVFYPLVSILLGSEFPRMVTHIMPCPVISLSIVVYSGYKKKKLLLLALLTIWGLTGIKSVIFQAYEDIILLICGFYGVWLLYKEMRAGRSSGLPWKSPGRQGPGI